jgi:hypothetical protein
MSSEPDVLESLKTATGGVTLAELLLLHPEVKRRTLQRWLSAWLESGELEAEGQGRARRFHAAGSRKASGGDFPDHIPLSPDSQDILAYIDRPLGQRKPVGYQREFLDSYEPGSTWYLPEPLRQQLHRIGDTGQSQRPSGTHGREILQRLLIDLSWASSHLEGNTYSRLDTRELFEKGKAADGKAKIETQMLLNHKAAIEMLVENIEEMGFNRYTLAGLHGVLAENLLPNPADEGRLRQHIVEISKSVYRPLSVPAQIEELFDLFLDKASRIGDPFEQSFFALVHLPYLQPFADVNKRTSRLAANLPLIRANLCPLTFLDVPEKAYSRAVLGIYEMTRIELLRDLYMRAYERSTQEYLAIRQEPAEPNPLRLAYRSLIKSAIREVVLSPEEDPLTLVRRAVVAVGEEDRDNVLALINEELRRIHEGVLARYGLRPSELAAWQARRSPGSISERG